MTASGLQVERATAMHAEVISDILRTAFAEFQPLYTDGGFAATTPSPDAIRERLEQGPAWLARVDGEVVGTVSAVIRGDRLYVRGMAVRPSLRGAGIGASLLRAVEEFAAAQGLRSLYLSTTHFLYSAIKLYETHGFRRTGEGPKDLFGTTLLTMEKSLQP